MPAWVQQRKFMFSPEWYAGSSLLLEQLPPFQAPYSSSQLPPLVVP